MEIRSSHTQQPEPSVLQPEQPQPPMVYVYDDLTWEYKFVPGTQATSGGSRARS